MVTRRALALAAAVCLLGCAAPENKRDPNLPVIRDPKLADLKSIKGRLLWPCSIPGADGALDGLPIPGMEVACYRLGNNLERFGPVFTDAEGRFTIEDCAIFEGERFSLVAVYDQRRWAVVASKLTEIGQRGGGRMSDLDRSESLRVVDTPRGISGRYDALTYSLEKDRAVPARRLVWNPKSGKAEAVSVEPVGILGDATLSELRIEVLPILERDKTNWSDGDKPSTGFGDDRPRPELELCLDKLPPDLKSVIEKGPGLRRMLEETFLLAPEIRSWTEGALARTGPRLCDLRSLADWAPINSKGSPSAAELKSERFPIFQGRAPDRSALKGKRIILSPGHGFYLKPGQDSSDPASWASPRTFISREANPLLRVKGIIEGDLSVDICRRLAYLLEANGAEVLALREIKDLTREGVDHPADAQFKEWDPGADPKLPRLWEQSAKYYLGRDHPEWLAGAPGLLARDEAPAPHPSDGAWDDNRRSVRCRVEAFRALAAGSLDAFVSVHTNAGGQGLAQTLRRGTTALYLDVAPDAERCEPKPGGGWRPKENANRGGERLSRLMVEEVAAAAGTEALPLLPLSKLGRGIAVLRDTYPHFFEVPADNGRNKTALFRRVARLPDGVEAGDKTAGLIGADDKGWFRQPFPKAVPASLIEAAFHNHRDDAALLQHGWFRQRIALGIFEGLARSFKEDA